MFQNNARDDIRLYGNPELNIIIWGCARQDNTTTIYNAL